MGSGLGLALSRQFAQMMGGDMTAENIEGKPGDGAIFRFTIRVRAIDAAHMTKDTSRRVVGLADGEGEYRILVVDDNEANRKLLSQLLQPLGFAVRQAATGAAALLEAARWRPHLIWMDVHLPDMSGDAAARQIRAGAPDPAPVIVATTATAFTRMEEEWDTAVYDDLVRKPVQTDRILAVLAEHLSVRYRYAADAGPAASGEDMAHETAVSALSTLPTPLRRRLRTAARQTDMSGIESVIAAITEEHPALGTRLTRLADRFEYDRILAMLDTVEASHE
jgi:CheY-like chemotaxis protein